MKAQPLSRISRADLNSLMTLPDVEVVALSECLVNAGFRLERRDMPAPGIHYVMKGTGRVVIRKRMSYEVAPHTLVIVPSHTPLVLEPTPESGALESAEVVQSS